MNIHQLARIMAVSRSDHIAFTISPNTRSKGTIGRTCLLQAGLQAFVQVISKRETGGKSSHSERLYLMSKRPTAQHAATLIRGHWQIENSLHWSLDVVMADDHHRARKEHAPANFAALRRIELNIIKANTEKGSNRGKFKKAGWSNNFLKKLITEF